MEHNDQPKYPPFPTRTLEPANLHRLQYEMYRSVRDFLEELSAQGLLFTFDKQGRTHWHWVDLKRWSERGFWSLGEALDDALAFRFPLQFTHPDALPDQMARRIKAG